jgi:hypothetical protein
MIHSFYSSFLFLIISILSYLCKHYAYSYYFLLLLYTSILFRYDKNIYTYYLDQLSILLIILYGGSQYIKKYKSNFYNRIIFLSFISTLLIYLYNSLHENNEFWHSMIHSITFIAHSMIILQ